ncbi:MAG TPA: MAPEG family protein [Magnetospirillaceae bacterium]|nr:MAPEG family protein [Magnetospirillaceae bacterium]
MVPHPYSALATLIALAIYIWTAILVSKARTRYGIAAPACTGNEEFERRFRVQMNTQEQLVLLLPALWLCAIWVGEFYAGIGGLVWCIGRVIYVASYIRDPKSRAIGFVLTIVPTIVMMVADAIRVVQFMLLG